MRNTKIVATLGPANDAPCGLTDLLVAGVDVFRLNASHGTLADHADRIERIRSSAAAMGVHPAILLDLQGPKIRLGKFENGRCVLESGRIFTITIKDVLGNAEQASTTYGDFAKDVKRGDRVLLADGSVELRVLDTDATSVRGRIVSGGALSDHKGINLPGVKISAPALTRKDIGDLDFGLEHGVDFVALSFVREADDVGHLRDMLRDKSATTRIISKIEKPEGWEHFDEILKVSDGIMVARGDLGVEVALEKVPLIQKTIIELARKSGKPVIIATQMLESMIDKPTPTRAEVSDVANAIYDGADAVMLSGETAVGKYPVEAVKMMVNIAVEAESNPQLRAYAGLPSGDTTYAEIIAAAAVRAAAGAEIAGIAVFTTSGFAGRLIARLRPHVPAFAFTPSPAVARQLSLSYGMHPVLASAVESTDRMLAMVDEQLLKRGYLKRGEGIAVMAGRPIEKPGGTNFLTLHRLGESSA
ncbi:MAG: pyruvate kinase [Candidatus Binataceae bacterium]